MQTKLKLQKSVVFGNDRLGVWHSFSSRLAWRIAGLLFASLSLIQVLAFVPARDKYEDILLHQVKSVGIATIGPILGPRAADLDPAYFQSLKFVNGITGVRLCGSDGTCLRSFGEAPDLFTADDTKSQRPLMRRSEDGARLEIKWSTSVPENASGFVVIARLDSFWVATDLKNFTWYWFASALVVAAVLALVLMVALGPLVLHPVLKLHRTIRAVNRDPLKAARYIRQTIRRDEIGGVIRAYNHTALRRQHQLNELVGAQTELKRLLGEAELSAVELKQARDAAEQANKSKSEFLATMSHELRTPLNAIIGFSDIIKSQQFGPVGTEQYSEYAADINNSGQHLLQLINDILDLSKVESGLEELHENDIDVPTTLRSILVLVRQIADRDGIEIELDIADNLPRLHADQRKLKQILINLMSNAVKFSDEGGRVVLSTWCDANSGFVFQITDTGIGMAPDEIPKALAKFGQIDSDLNRKHDGTGLGLPLSKSLIELHDGSFDLQSQAGVGTTVTVVFPPSRIVATEPHQPDESRGRQSVG